MSNARKMDESACKTAAVAGMIHATPTRPVLPRSPEVSPLTVCHTVYGLERGGLERQLTNVVRHLPTQAFRHVLVVRNWNDGAARQAAALGDGVTVVGVAGGGPDRDFVRKLADILERHRVDVLHVRGLTMLVDAVVAAEWAGHVPTVSSFHGFEDADASITHGIRRKVLREALLRCRLRWAVSRSAADAACRGFYLHPDAFDVVENGVDTDVFAPAADRAALRTRLGIPAEAFVLLSVGNIKPVKGHDTLIEAMSRIECRGSIVALVGEDHSHGAISRRIAERGLSGVVRCVGSTDDVLPWYQAADAFVLPSRFEGLSNALLEAMSCGLAVAATAVGGNRDVVEHGVCGLLTSVDDPAALADALASIRTDAALRAQLGQAARTRVVEKYGVHIMLRGVAERYRAAAESRFATECEDARHGARSADDRSRSPVETASA